jgi:uncharacterized protein (DUF2267 family)
MDLELRQRLFQTLNSVQQSEQLTLTPHAVTLITVVIETIADTTSPSLTADTTRNAQLKAIETLPEALKLAQKAYQTKHIDGLMLLTVMPRFMANFCPPFQNPPPY